MATYTDEVLVLSSGLTTQMGSADQLSFSTSIIVADGKGLQGLNATSDVAVTLGDAAGATNFIVEDSSNVDVMIVDSDGNVAIKGNLDVTGNIISRDEERVLVADNFLDINFGYTSTTALEGGIAVNYDAVAGGVTINTTSNAITFAAATGDTEPVLTLATPGGLPANTFAAGDIVQIAGTTNAENDGFYIVNDQGTIGVLDIKSTATTTPDTINFKAAQVNFTGEVENTSTAVTIFQVNVNILQTSATGAWQVQNGNTDADFATFTPLGTSTLQQAYDAGATITTDASGAIAFTLSEDNQGFSVEGDDAGDGDVSIGGTTAVSSIVMDASGAASSWTSTGQTLSFATTGSNELDITSGGALDLNGVAVTIDGSGGVDITAADGQIASFNHVGGSALAINATGQIDLTGESGSDLNIGATQGDVGITTTTSGGIAVTSAGTLSCTGASTSTFGDDVATIVYDGAGAMAQTATGASSVTVTSGNYSIATATSGSVDIDAVTNVTVDGAAITIGGDADSAAITIGSTADVAHAIVVDGGNSTVTIGGDGAMKLGDSSSASVTLNAAAAVASVDLQVAGTSYLALDGTLNRMESTRGLYMAGASTTANLYQSTSVKLTAAANLAIGEIVYMSAAGSVNLAKGDQGNAGDAVRTPVGVAVAAITSTNGGPIGVGGIVPIKVSSDGDANAVGKPVYLDTTAGEGVQIPPTTGTVFQVGILHTAASSGLGLMVWQPRKVADQA